MKPRVPLETTIPSYLTAWPSQDVVMAGHQQTTKQWWETRRQDFELFVSQFVIDEASVGDPDAARRRLDALANRPLLDPIDDVYAVANEPSHAAADRGGRRRRPEPTLESSWRP